MRLINGNTRVAQATYKALKSGIYRLICRIKVSIKSQFLDMSVSICL